MADARARELLNSVKGPLPKAVARLEVASRALPADTDFHFYCNFPQFKRPLQELTGSISALLSRIGTARELRTEPAGFVDEPDEVHDWLIALQDDLLEKVGGALDEFQRVRNERKRRKGPDFDEVAMDSRKKGRTKSLHESSLEETLKLVKIAKRGSDAKGSVPTYIKSIPRPQDKFDVAVDNSNTPFQHPTKVVHRSSGLLDGGVPIPVTMVDTGGDDVQAKIAEEAAEPASSSVYQGVASVHYHLENLENYANKLKLRTATHPLEDELRSLEYKDGLLLKVEPEEPLPLAATPFTFVDTEAGLKELAAKLSSVREIAVDLENHHYRSFQGFVCIMQISTRTEDFIVDTLALRSQIGPYLGAIFSNSDVKKIMHGADRDVVWLQRDFGIYLCNLFDTGQAARVLEFPAFGLGFLLQHFCTIYADKRYQLADWRLRPLTPDMLRYAREDTHYLLYIYDRLRQLLIAAEKPEDPLLQVFQCSREVCLKLYEKELLTDTSHLHLYGLIEKKLRPLQLGVLAELYAWRDQVARKEDESTGFVCPNKLLLQLAEQMPQSLQELQKLLKGVRTLVHQQPGTILSIIRSTKENFLRRMDVEVGESSKTSLSPDPTDQSQLQEGKSDISKGQKLDEIVTKVQEGKSDVIEGQELDETRTQFQEGKSDKGEGQEFNENVSQFPEGKSDSKESQELDKKVSKEGGAGGSAELGILVKASGRPVEGFLNQQAAGTQSSFREDVSLGRVVSSPAIVRRAMVSSLFASRSRSSLLRKSVQCSIHDAVPSQLCNAPAEVNSDANRTCSPEQGATTENSPVPEELTESQTFKMQAPCSFVDAETSSGMDCNDSACAGTSSDGLEETALPPTGLSMAVEMRSPGLSICTVLPPDDSGNLSADCSKRTDAAQDGTDFPAESMQVDPGGNTGLPATTEDVDAASSGAIVEHFSQVQREGVAARRSGGFASLLGRPSKKHAGSKILDEELMDARRKAEQITSSICLPFNGALMNLEDATAARSQTQALVTDMSSKTVLQKLGVKVRDNVKVLLQQESKEWGEVVSFEGGDDRLEMVNEYQQMPDSGEKRQHRWAGRLPEALQPAEGEPASTSSSFPTPLSAAQRVLRKDQNETDLHKRDKKGIPRFDRNSWKKRKAMGTQASSSEPDGTRNSKKKRQQKSSFQFDSASASTGGVEIPFDYEAAKQVLGVEVELNKNRSDDRPHEKTSGKRKKPNARPTPLRVFDPYRPALTEPKPEGIRPGNRRQVFPQSGNRSVTFK